MEGTRQYQIALAEEQQAAYPQYKGHFDDYDLAEVTQDYGRHFKKGDLVLAKNKSMIIGTTYCPDFRAYSPRSKVVVGMSIWAPLRFLKLVPRK